MRTITICILIVLSQSCTSIKNAVTETKNENVFFHENKKDTLTFSNSGNPIMNIGINGFTKSFFIDTGSPTFLFFNEMFIAEFPKNNKNYYPSMGFRTPDRKKKTAYTFVMDSISSILFHGVSKTAMVINNEDQKCKKNIVAGIVGNDLFNYSHFPIYYDFENSHIKTINSSFNKKGFKEIESKFKTIGSKILIKLSINNVDRWFTFDTGYSGFIHLSEHNLNTKKIEIDNALFFADLEPNINRASIYSDVKIEINSLPVFNGQVTSYSNVKSTLVGMKFIKNFDWLVDYSNKRLYIRPNKGFEHISNSFKDYSNYKYKSKVVRDQIMIVGKAVDENKYNIGDIVLSINNHEISAKNICEMQELLASTNDWDKLSVKTHKSNFVKDN